MGTFFQAVGVIVTGLILLILVAYFGFKYYIRLKLGKQLARVVEHGSLDQPARIQLEEIGKEDIDAEEFHQLVSGLDPSRFTETGYFLIPELGDTCLYAAYSQDKKCCLVIYQHLVGCFFDLVAKLEDGTNLTYSTAPFAAGMEYPPGEEKHFLSAETSIDQAYQQLIERAGSERQILTQPFVEYFEQAYAKEMDWRLTQGISEQEVRNQAALSGQEVSDEQVQSVLLEQNQQYSEELDNLVIHNFLDRSQISAKEWNQYQNNLLVLHEKTSLEYLQELLYWYVEELDNSTILTNIIERAENCWELLEELNNYLPDRFCFQQIGQIDDPVNAKLFYNPNYSY